MTQEAGDERAQAGNSLARRASQAISLGTNLAVGVGLFTFLGYYVDGKRGGGIFWTLCGLVLGLVYGAYEIWKVIRILNSAGASGDDSEMKDPGKQ